MCNLKTDKQYDTKRDLYSHDFIYAGAVKGGQTYTIFYEQTELNNEMYALQF